MIALSQDLRERMTIGEAAEAVGVATTTLRYYERQGILAPTARTAKGYRLYDADALERLRFIRSAQVVGFTLEDIRSLLKLDARTSCKSVQSLLYRRLAQVEQKLGDLQRVRNTLADALERCRKSEKGCAVLADLKRKHQAR